MSSVRDIVLISSDLMFASRLDAVARAAGIRVTRVPSTWAPAPARAAFVDLNMDVEARMEAIRSLRAHDPLIAIIGFCGHQEKERRTQAMAAGATQVVTNGSLQSAALRLIGAAPA